MMQRNVVTVIIGLLLMAVGESYAQTFPFLESFDNDTANWKDISRQDLTFVATGGADGGGYVSTEFAFAAAGSFGAVPFRGEASFGASDGAFVGDWIAAGVEGVSMRVRHNAPIPLVFGARFASPFNFPGTSAIRFQPVLPSAFTGGQFTEMSFAIEEGNPAFVTFEGSDFQTVFSNIGNVQVSADIPSSFAVIDEILINAAAVDPAITLPTNAILGDVFDEFTVINTLLVDDQGDPILDGDNEQQFVDVQVPSGDPIFNTSLAITFDLDEVSITAVPEPTAACLACLVVMHGALARRRR